MTKDGAVAVIVPRHPSRRAAVDSQLIAGANLAKGFVEALGPDRVILATDEGVISPDDLMARSVRAGGSPSRNWSARLPQHFRLLLGDLQAIAESRRFNWFISDRPLNLVVQYHHRFQNVGLRLARHAKCPLFLRVEALEVDEQRAWGAGRPLTGRMVAAVGEHRIMRKADLISVVSQPLAEAVLHAGVAPQRVIVMPNPVALDVFQPCPPVDEGFVAEHELADEFLVGWVGGFRPYHGLNHVEPFLTALEQRLPNAVLCLMGAGPLRAQMEELAALHPRSLRLLPPVPQAEVPAWLCRFDVCIQFANEDAGNHYSPLKVTEYLACGRPVIAPDFATSKMLVDGVDAILYPPDSTSALVDAVAALHDSDELRASLGHRARVTAENLGSWADVARLMLSAVEDLNP